ncbi:MAG: molecular chaperone DnaK (HSP70) [Lentimonas sp.]|jgi:molecular chaperone DnaK (HSP70)
MAARYFIGIDLGTSNCALAYIDSKDPDARTQVFSIPQFESLDSVQAHSTLPSFTYYLSDSDIALLQSDSADTWSRQTVVGRYAQKCAASAPERTISSAKSWLCHAGIDRESKCLPWKSQAINDEQKRSAVEASAAYLDYLRFAWDQTIGAEDKQSRFERQDVVITVPASFDTVAQRLTLNAAALANYPKSTRLLEEPQAAFYAWLEKHPKPEQWLEILTELDQKPQVILVCDIGGGTSDFSLFEIARVAAKTLPNVRRIAVSNHILLGGDNIDLALAHMAEAQSAESAPLRADSWSQLTAQCKELKERVLSSAGEPDETFTIVLTPRSGNLFASAQTISLRRQELTRTILEGFFPHCQADAKPNEISGGLREIGLPYAQDSAITHHLADFLRQRKVDAILFNGGSLAAPELQNRLTAQVAHWQGGVAPKILANQEQELAVARGAAWYPASLQRAHSASIEAGSGHSFYIEVECTAKKRKKKGSATEKRLVCVLPQGAPIEALTRITALDLSLKINTPVQFQAYTSTCREADAGADLVAYNAHDFQRLPSMHTMAQLPPGEPQPDQGSVPIQLEAHLNNLGILHMSCVSVRRIQGQNRSWNLSFNLRQSAAENTPKSSEASQPEIGISSEELQSAQALIQSVYSDGSAVPATAMLKQLESLSHAKRREWNLALNRELWQPLSESIMRRNRSPEHELAWLNAAGFCLRPGYGHPLDTYYLRTLWLIQELDLAHPSNKASREQYFLLWRRVAGGLSAAQQETLYQQWIEKTLQDTKQSYEPARMLAAFEHLPAAKRLKLAQHFTTSILARKDGYCDHAIWALGRLLNRVPLYGGQHSILDAAEVERAFETLAPLDWSQENVRNLPQLFLQAARIVNNRDHDVPTALRKRIITKASESGYDPQRLIPLKEFTVIDSKDIQQLFGESLPAGLLVGERST